MWTVSVEHVLWAAGFIGHAALLFVLVIRHRIRRFPIFTALVGYNIIRTVFLFWLYRSASLDDQYHFYWVSVALGDVLEVAFIFELAVAVMRATGVMVKQALRPFLVWSTVSVVAAALVSQVLTLAKPNTVDLWDMRATYFATCLTCFLYLSMLRGVNAYHLPWRSHVMTIGQGFAAWQFVSALMDSTHVLRGWYWSDKSYDTTSKIAYLGVLVFWTVGLWRPERELCDEITPDSARMILDLAKKSAEPRAELPPGKSI